MDEGDQVLAPAHQVDLMHAQLLIEQRLLDLKDHVAAVIDLLGAIQQFRACGSIVLIMKIGPRAGALFHQYTMPILDQLCTGFRSCGDAVLTVHDFLWDADDHDEVPPCIYVEIVAMSV